ncbi:MAG: SDR family oxidoreductase [Dysgonamonadaceae bacterium]|jgi:putative NADH-flavin reductase|nr:SDR family oxidoreductase [Dysgonamonadaceae bacterium]
MSEQKLGKIAVIGGTGKAGCPLVKQILKRGYSIRMLVRNPEKVTVKDENVEIIKGDARNLESIQALLEGCDAVLSTLGQPKGESPIFSTATSHVLNTMKEKEIKRYILVTGMGINVPGDKKGFKDKLMSKIMKMMFPAIILDKQKEYEILSKSNLDWTLVRLPLIVEEPSTGNIKIHNEHVPGKKISSEDLADFLTNQITATGNIRKTPFIAN